MMSRIEQVISDIEAYLDDCKFQPFSNTKIIVDKALTASRARVAAKRARELTRRKGGLELTTQWGKTVRKKQRK